MNRISEKPIKMSILSVPTHLPIVRAVIEKICEQIGFEPETSGNVVLSVDEALTNIIKHAYHGAADQPIEIELSLLMRGGRQGLRIQLRDYGRCVDPAEIKSRDLQDVRPGGLGVHIMQECMDQIEFVRAQGGGTLLTMVKLPGNVPSKQEANK